MMEVRRIAIVPAALGIALVASPASFAGDLHHLRRPQIFLANPAQAPVAAAPAAGYYQVPATGYVASAPQATYAQAPTFMAAPQVTYSQAPTIGSAPVMIGAASSASAPTTTTYLISSTGLAPTTGLSPTTGLAPSGGGRRLLPEFQRRAILQDLRDAKVEGSEEGMSGHLQELIAKGREKYIAALGALNGDDGDTDELTSDQRQDVEYLVEMAIALRDAPSNVTPLTGEGGGALGLSPVAAYAPQQMVVPAYGFAPQPVMVPQAYAPVPQQQGPLVGYLYPKARHLHPHQPPVYKFKGL